MSTEEEATIRSRLLAAFLVFFTIPISTVVPAWAYIALLDSLAVGWVLGGAAAA